MCMPGSARRLSFVVLTLSLFCLLISSSCAVALSSGPESILYTFPAGDSPSGLIQAGDGNFYGAVRNGGANGVGYVFSLSPGGTLTVIYSFAGASDGGVPEASLIEGNDGNLYGTNTVGGLGNGVLFRLTFGGAITVLHDFIAGTDGAAAGSLIQDNAGDLFGVASTSGASGFGTVFEYSHAGVFSVVHTFTGASGDGAEPVNPLLQASDGLIYGVTVLGGNNATDMFGDRLYIGTIYRFDPSNFNSFATVASLPSDVIQPYLAVAAYPTFGLTEGPDGALYGLTALGGAQPHGGDGGEAGTMYRVTVGSAPALHFPVHIFDGFRDGNEPKSALTLGGDGYFYGTASMSGPETADNQAVKHGTVFQSDTAGNINVIYSFVALEDNPLGAPLQGSDGVFYGRASAGSSAVIYKVVPLLMIPPVTLTATASALTVGQSATLSWKVSNAFSQTAANCYAHGAWSGSRALIGSQTITPAATGTYSYALTCGGVESALTTITVTPSVNGPTATPVISPGGGLFNGPQPVTITDSTPGAVIYYTTDGSKPTTGSKTWNNIPLVINQNETLHAIAIASPLTVSSMASATFTISDGNSQTCSLLYNQGFRRHSGLALNNGASVVNAGLFLTHGNLNEYTSAFAKQKIPLNNFVTDFKFRFKNAAVGPAGGMSFVVQANNANALGSAGGNLGYSGIPNSMALKFDLYNNVGQGQNSVGLFFNGTYPGTPAVDLTPSGINLRSGHTMDAHVTYDGAYLTLSLKDTDTQAQFYYAFPVSTPNPFGAGSAYAGFTASTGAMSSTTEIVGWTLQSAGGCIPQ